MCQWCYYSDCEQKSERVELFICDSNGYVIVYVAWYTYTYRPLKAELIVHYDNPVHMSHVTLILHDQTTHLPSSLP